MFTQKERRIPTYTPTALEIGKDVRVYVEPMSSSSLSLSASDTIDARFIYQDESGDCVLYDYMSSLTFIVQGSRVSDNSSFGIISRFEERETFQELFNHDGVLSYNKETIETKMEYVRINEGDTIDVYLNCQFEPRQEEATVVFCNDDFITVVADDVPFTFSRREAMNKNIVHVSNDGIKKSCRLNIDVFAGWQVSEVSED
ncbi:hypothetical protein vBValMR11Z_161 [Vibrio phage vB_ValM_R11Z]|nr:hypothetical protein vBValMR11Z_161 [Vibrio phage vB_ValM_R11Z]